MKNKNQLYLTWVEKKIIKCYTSAYNSVKNVFS